MKSETKYLMQQFEEKSGILAKSASQGVGSMKEFIYITVRVDETVRAFIDQFYSPIRNRSIKDVQITYLESEYKGTTVFIINRSHLL